MTYQNLYNRHSGIIVFEILLAMTIGTIMIIILYSLYTDSENIFEYSVNKNLYIDNFLDAKDILPVQVAHSTYSSGNIKLTTNHFGNNLLENIVDIDSTTTKMITNTNRIDSIKFSFIKNDSYYNIHSFTNDGMCSPFFAKNRVVGSYDYFANKDISPILDIKPENIVVSPISIPISLPITDIQIRNNIAYISTDSAKQSDPDIFVVDISDTNNPKILSSLNTGPGISMISVYKDHIYAAVRSTVSQLHIIKINNPSNIFLENKYSLSLPYATATPTVASSIYFSDNKIFLGTEKWIGDEFYIFDFSNNILKKIYSYNIDSKVNDIYVHKNNIFVSASSISQFINFAFSDTWNISEIKSFSPSGWSRQEGNISNSFEDSLYFGRTSGGFNIVNDKELFYWRDIGNDISSPDFSLDEKNGVYGLLADRDFVYIGTREYGKEFQILDKDLATSTGLYVHLPVGVEKMSCYRSSIYVLGYGVPVIYKIDFK